MFAGFAIQGYETDTGSHQQFLLVQGPQLQPAPADMKLETAGAYTLNLGTIVRALFTTLGIEPGRTLFVEGAATGTGLDALKTAVRSGIDAIGLVSSEERAAFVRAQGAKGAVNRRDPRFAGLFTTVPDGADAAAAWQQAGEALVQECREALGGRLPDYVVSHAGETAFPRSFQLLAEGGTLTFFGASSGYWFSFVGKPGAASPAAMLRRARLRAGEAVLVYYGVADGAELIDQAGLEMIEAARAGGARVVVATLTDGQREFIQSLGFGDSVRGVVTIEELHRREGEAFEWPSSLPRLPDPKRETAAFKEAVRAFQERTTKPFGAAVGRVLRSADNPRGAPDLIIERAGHDALGVFDLAGQAVYRPGCLCRGDARPPLHLLRAAGLDAAAAHPDANRDDRRDASVQRLRGGTDERDARRRPARRDRADGCRVAGAAGSPPGDVGEPAPGRHLCLQSRIARVGPAVA